MRKKTTTLQEKLDAVWTSETLARDPRNRERSIRADIDDTTRQQPSPTADSGRPSPKPDVCGGSYDQSGGAGPAQYTPQPFSGFNPRQPHGSMQMGATPGWTPMPMPYGAQSMSPQYHVPVYGGQQQTDDATGADAIPNGTG